MMKIPSDELRDDTVRALRAVFGEQRFKAEAVLKAITGDALLHPANARLRDSLVRLCRHRTPSPVRIGKRLNKYLVRRRVDDVELRSDTFERGSLAYEFQSFETPEESRASLDAFLLAAAERRQQRAEKLEGEMVGKSPSRTLAIIDRETRRAERFEKRMKREAEHAEAVRVRKEMRQHARSPERFAHVADPLEKAKLLYIASKHPDFTDVQLRIFMANLVTVDAQGRRVPDMSWRAFLPPEMHEDASADEREKKLLDVMRSFDSRTTLLMLRAAEKQRGSHIPLAPPDDRLHLISNYQCGRHLRGYTEFEALNRAPNGAACPSANFNPFADFWK